MSSLILLLLLLERCLEYHHFHRTPDYEHVPKITDTAAASHGLPVSGTVGAEKGEDFQESLLSSVFHLKILNVGGVASGVRTCSSEQRGQLAYYHGVQCMALTHQTVI